MADNRSIDELNAQRIRDIQASEPTRTATFLERLVELPDMVQEVFLPDAPYERNELSLLTDTITPTYASHFLVMAVANDLVKETVVYSHVPGVEDVNSMTLGVVPGAADVKLGLRSMGYEAFYPEGEGPVQVPALPTAEDEDEDPLGEVE